MIRSTLRLPLLIVIAWPLFAACAQAQQVHRAEASAGSVPAALPAPNAPGAPPIPSDPAKPRDPSNPMRGRTGAGSGFIGGGGRRGMEPATVGRMMGGPVGPGMGGFGGGGYGGPGMAPSNDVFGMSSAPEPQLSDERRTLEVFALKYADPSVVANMIQELHLPSGGPRSFVDARTNSLILLGTDEEFRLAKDLIQKLDVQAQEPPSTTSIRVYSLLHAKPKSIGMTLQQLLGPRGTIAVVDDRSNQIAVSGDINLQRETQDILERLDQPSPPPESSRKAQDSYRVRLAWLVTDDKAQQIPDDLQDVADELVAMGITDLRLGAQAIVQTFAEEDFAMKCVPNVQMNCGLDMKGTVTGSRENPQVKVQIKISTIGDTTDAATMAQLGTALSVPIGHKVVIGSTPIGQNNSVFVIQLQEVKTDKSPERSATKHVPTDSTLPKMKQPAATPTPGTR